MEKFKKRIKRYISKVWKAFNRTEMRVLPGNVAFFLVLALIPIVTFVAYIATYFSISLSSLINLIENLLPEEPSKIIVDIISGKGLDTSVGTFNIVALVVASNGMYAIVNTSNTLYKVKEIDVLRSRIKSFLLLIIVISLIIFLLLVPVFGGTILSLFGNTKIISQLVVIYNLLKWPITFFLMYFTIKLIYTIAPNTVIASSTTTYGALFTTFCWTIATAIFSYYLKYFAHYNIVYGNLSSIIILMIWIYIMSYVLVLGMAINAVNINDKN